MIEWLGPIVYEYYGGSEGNGSTFITPEEWLEHPGSVGRADWGTLHICDDAGEEVGPGIDGLVYFEGGWDFQYLNDPEKTRDARHPHHPGWSTLGDIGHVDADGYLYLTDRKSFMIISGGVNIYPQETENLLITHPRVAFAGKPFGRRHAVRDFYKNMSPANAAGVNAAGFCFGKSGRQIAAATGKKQPHTFAEIFGVAGRIVRQRGQSGSKSCDIAHVQSSGPALCGS